MATIAEQHGIPMPEPTVPRKPFSSFKALSFDIYGTLIDWKASIINSLIPRLTSQIPDPNSPFRSAETDDDLKLQVLTMYEGHETDIQREKPSLNYDKVLEESYLRLAKDFNIEITHDIRSQASDFGGSIGTWPAFPDTVDAMKRLGKHFKLIVLSNVDNASFSKACAGSLSGVPFWRIHTAEDIGSYKPDLRNFEYLLRKVDEDDKSEGGRGIAKEELVHVAQSIFHDHLPAKKMGMSSAWINRDGASNLIKLDKVKSLHENGEIGYGWRYPTLGALADEVEKQIRESS